MKHQSLRTAFWLGCCLCFLLVCAPLRAATPQVPAVLNSPQLSLLPYLDAYLDTTGEMDVEEVAAPANAPAFHPLDVKHLPHATGTTWLRFTLAPAAQGADSSTILLDLGESIPGRPALFSPGLDSLSGATEWQEATPGSRKVLLLPRSGPEALTCYIRLDGLPGLWFAPMLRTPHNAATDLSGLAGKSALLALGVVMLLCLLRGLSEPGQWRFWTALYVGMAMVQGYYGLPGNGAGHFDFQDAAALLSPGLALMMLPHVGRHLMQTRGRHRILDAQFILLVLPGAALALLPLIPEMGWITRYLPLWPAGALLLVPTSTAACLMGLPGARRFLLGCLIPPLAVAASVMGLEHGYAPSLLAALPLWGTALSALLIAATAAPRHEAREDDPIDLTMPALEGVGNAVPVDAPLTMGDEPLPTLDDPNLRLLPAEAPAAGLPLPHMDEPSLTAARPAPAGAASARSGTDSTGAVSALKEQLSQPLDTLLREAAALQACTLPPGARETAGQMADTARRMASLLAGKPAGQHGQAAAAPVEEDFNLQELMRSVHDAVAAAAERAGISLAWYMPPQLPALFRGDHASLYGVLHELLESAVRATHRGSVHVSVRPMPESLDPGHLLFTIRDSGSGLPPQERSALALAHAWELAGRYEGLLRAEADGHGAVIAFSLHLLPVEQERASRSMPEQPARPQTSAPAADTAPVADMAKPAPEPVAPAAAPVEDDGGPKPLTTPDLGRRARRPRIMICVNDEMEQHSFIQKINDLPYVILQTRTLREALAMHEHRPQSILIVAGRNVTPEVAPALARFRQRASEAHLPVFAAIAITQDDSQWDALAHAGFTHALLEPVQRETLRETVQEILSSAQPVAQPAAASREETPAAPAAVTPTAETAERDAAPSAENAAAGQQAMPENPPVSPAASVMPETEGPADAVSPQSLAEEAPAVPDAQVASADETDPVDPTVTAPLAETPSPAPAAAAGTESHQPAAPEKATLDNRWGPRETVVEAVTPAQDTRVPLDNRWGETPASRQDAAVSHETGNTQQAPDAVSEEAAVPQAVAATEAAAAPVTAAASAEVRPAASAPEHNVREQRPARPAPRIGSGLLPGAEAYDSHVEWVGEPTPIVRTAEKSPAPAIPQRRVPGDGAETLRHQITDIVRRTSQPAAASTPDAGATEVPTVRLSEALRQEEARAGGEETAASAMPAAQPAAGSAPRSVDRPAAVTPHSSSSAPAPADRLPEGPSPDRGAPSLLRRVLGRLQGSETARAASAGRAPLSVPGRETPAAVPQAQAATRTPGQSVAQTSAPSAVPLSSTQAVSQTASQKVSQTASEASGPAVDLSARRLAEPQAGPVEPPVRQPAAGSTGAPFPASPAASAPAVDTEMLDLVKRLSAAIQEAQQHYARRDCRGVADAAQYIAQSAESYGFRSLGRMARCVEQAGRHDDLDALRDLLPDLVAQVERRRIAIGRELS